MRFYINRVRAFLSAENMAWAVLVLLLSGILYTPLMGDDLPMFQLRINNPEWDTISIHSRAQVLVKQFLPMGRLTVVSFYYTEWVFKTFTTIWMYKGWLLILNLFTIIVFVNWLKMIGFQFDRSILLVCISVGLQFRLNYHDAYTSYMGLCQIFNCVLFLSSGLWLMAYRNPKVLSILAAVLTSLLLFFISEFALLLLLLIPLLYWISDSLKNQSKIDVKWKKIATWTLPIVGISAFYLVAIAMLRRHYPAQNMYSGLTSNLDPWSMIVLELKQLYAALPLTNLTNTPRIPLRTLHQLKFWDVALVFLLLLVFLIRILGKRNRSTDFSDLFRTNFGLLLGIGLWSATTVFILPSLKYQSELTWGNGYLALLTQNLGMGLILYTMVQRVFQNNKRPWVNFMVKLFLIAAVLITFLFNHSLSKKYWYKKSYPAEVMWQFIREKQLDVLPDSSVIVMQHDFFYRSPDLYNQIINHHSKPRIFVIDYEGECAKSGRKSWEIASDLPNNSASIKSSIPLIEHKIYGLFVTYDSEISIRLCPISIHDLQNKVLKPSGPWICEKLVRNPIPAIAADLD